ncbi:MAG: dihydropteroate synthase [Proteobacteria bacterium]|nr:dihydropteroate synthase [Pseudomonadota bacterium]
MPLAKPYVTPRGLLTGASAQDAVRSDRALPFGKDLAFTAVELTDSASLPTVQQTFLAKACPPASQSWIKAYAHAPDAFAGLSLAKPILMGVVNVTPDSFSDGGQFSAPGYAIAHARALMEAGASIIDVGGESTRPGAAPIEIAEEVNRVVPVVRALAERGICVSIDTRHAAVMEAAISAGARIVNDVTALTGEGALAVVAKANVAAILMHMQGEPRTMQDRPAYAWAPGDVFDMLEARIHACAAAGLPRARLAVDPGIGFGKNDIHNAQILDHTALYRALGCPVVIGASRKSFIGRMSRGEDAQHRLPGSLAAALHGVSQGAQILRVHDVAETRQALAVAGRINSGA